MGKYLITGVAGTGKTTIAQELQRRGYTAFDTDSTKGLGAWIDQQTGKPNPNFTASSAEDWVDRYDWSWDGEYLRKLLNGASAQLPAFFCGSSTNQEAFYSLFDKIILLEIDNVTLKNRLLHGERDHNYGKKPGEIEVILGWYKDFQARTREAGVVPVDARQSIKVVVDQILSIVHET